MYNLLLHGSWTVSMILTHIFMHFDINNPKEKAKPYPICKSILKISCSRFNVAVPLNGIDPDFIPWNANIDMVFYSPHPQIALIRILETIDPWCESSGLKAWDSWLLDQIITNLYWILLSSDRCYLYIGSSWHVKTGRFDIWSICSLPIQVAQPCCQKQALIGELWEG